MSAYQLTDKELTALRMIAQGKVPKQVVRDMKMSPHTYKDVIERVRFRLQATTTANAVYIACQRGIL
jgi:DNA-binding CsgD family transcriptional regulator